MMGGRVIYIYARRQDKTDNQRAYAAVIRPGVVRCTVAPMKREVPDLPLIIPIII